MRLGPEHPGKAQQEPGEGTLLPHLQTHVQALPCLPVLLGGVRPQSTGVDRMGLLLLPR